MEKENTDSDSLELSNVSYAWLILVLALVMIVQGALGYFIYMKMDGWNDRANFGEMFGFVNTLFSGWAFAGIIYAVILQKRELELQRNELKMTRNELRRSAEAHEKAEKAQSEQSRLMMRISS